MKIFAASVLSALAWVGVNSQAPAPPAPADSNLQGTSFLDHDAPIQDFYGKTFLKDNIPYIDIPDTEIQNVYYYRWTSLQRHLRYIHPGTGYIITEFVQPVGYAKAYGTIDAAAGHQIEEAQWLRSTYYDQDYVQVYTRGPAPSTQFTHWIQEAASSTANVTGDLDFLDSQLPGMIRMWHEWDYTFDSDVGLYYYTPNFDAQEYSLPGYVATHGVVNNLERSGPNTYRPSLNSYMVANARAIANAAKMLGQTSVSTEFNQYADSIETAIYSHLWDPAQNFFVDVIRPNNPDLSPIHGREEVGFYPFRFGIGLSPKYANPSIEQLFDPNGFLVEFAPTTLETRNQYYTALKPFSTYCCFWQGQSWPFSTAHTLKSLASVVRSGKSNATAEQYYQYLSFYAKTQHKNGVPYVAECHYPEQDAWSRDASNHSEHYMHSTNNNNVITGLLGLVPRADNKLEIDPIVPADWEYFALENAPYHGNLVTVLWDKSGTRYNSGKGLTIFCNGDKLYNGMGMKAIVTLPGKQPNSNKPAPKPEDVNIAANYQGLGAWPKASATHTFFKDDPYKAIDGVLFYDEIPDNRWTDYRTPSSNDTLTIQLPRPRMLSGIVLAIFADHVNQSSTGGVACPASIEITSETGKTLANLPDFASQCMPNDRNVISFGGEVEVQTVHINFFLQGQYAVGVCEVEMWVPANRGPFYYAVDALAQTDTSVVFDSASTATSNGAVLAPSTSNSEVDFSGIYSKKGHDVKLGLSYKNNGTETVSVTIKVNQIAAGSLVLPPVTKGDAYAMATLNNVELWKGTNFVTVLGGGEGFFLEGLKAN